MHCFAGGTIHDIIFCETCHFRTVFVWRKTNTSQKHSRQGIFFKVWLAWHMFGNILSKKRFFLWQIKCLRRPWMAPRCRSSCFPPSWGRRLPRPSSRGRTEPPCFQQLKNSLINFVSFCRIRLAQSGKLISTHVIYPYSVGLWPCKLWYVLKCKCQTDPKTIKILICFPRSETRNIFFRFLPVHSPPVGLLVVGYGGAAAVQPATQVFVRALKRENGIVQWGYPLASWQQVFLRRINYLTAFWGADKEVTALIYVKHPYNNSNQRVKVNLRVKIVCE